MATTTTHHPAPTYGRRSIISLVGAGVLAIVATVAVTAVTAVDVPTTSPADPATVSAETRERATTIAAAAHELDALREVVRVTPSVAPALREEIATLELVVTGRLPVATAAAAD